MVGAAEERGAWLARCVEAIPGGAVLYVVSGEGFKIEGGTWLLAYFAARRTWHSFNLAERTKRPKRMGLPRVCDGFCNGLLD